MSLRADQRSRGTLCLFCCPHPPQLRHPESSRERALSEAEGALTSAGAIIAVLRNCRACVGQTLLSNAFDSALVQPAPTTTLPSTTFRPTTTLSSRTNPTIPL